MGYRPIYYLKGSKDTSMMTDIKYAAIYFRMELHVQPDLFTCSGRGRSFQIADRISTFLTLAGQPWKTYKYVFNL